MGPELARGDAAYSACPRLVRFCMWSNPRASKVGAECTGSRLMGEKGSEFNMAGGPVSCNSSGPWGQMTDTLSLTY